MLDIDPRTGYPKFKQGDIVSYQYPALSQKPSEPVKEILVFFFILKDRPASYQVICLSVSDPDISEYSQGKKMNITKSDALSGGLKKIA